jgi:uncharacterized protein YwqG
MARASSQASVVNVGGFRPTGEPLATHFGMKPVGLTGEPWPEWNGKPLLFVCQLNLTAAPFVPSLLAEVKLLTFFIQPDLGTLAEENGSDWCLRAYPSLEDLAPLAPPSGATATRKGFECRWEEAKDRRGENGLYRTKIGGYASEIQAEPWWELKAHPAKPAYCLQINSEPKAGLQWGDNGAIYIGRGTAEGWRDHWFLDWQCY